ncbi:MAG: hypothetical protein Q7R73_02610 [bacterium]|nr:hypothetical protein [bacterium]
MSQIRLEDGTTIDVMEFIHMSKIVITKDNAGVEIVLGKESNNSIEVKTIAPLKVPKSA